MDLKNRSEDISRKLILSGSALVTLIITPNISYEPFNSPKFLVITIIAFALLTLLITSINIKSFYRFNPLLPILSLIFILQSLVVIFSSENLIILQLYGTEGRNTGFFLYLDLLILLLATSILSNQKFITNLSNLLTIVGIISALYGVIQLSGWDPYNWNNLNNPVFGFFGNPNFQSSFLGIVSAGLFAFIFKSIATPAFRVIIMFLLLLNLIVILSTDSQQGIIVFVSGFFISSYIAVLKSKNFSRLSKYYGFSILLSLIIVILDILQKLPWGSILYKPSVSSRGDLWRAAWKMAADNPITGIGFDSYEYFYRTYRDEVAVVSRGALTSNSAHNVLLDILSSGGFILLTVYLVIMLLVILAAYRVIKREEGYNYYFVSILAAWFAYQMQSIISINQIGLAVWGWILSGAIVGYERNTSSAVKIFKNSKSSFITYTKLASGLVIGLILGIIPIKNDVAFKSALDSRQIELVLASGYQEPQSPQRMLQVASLFKQNSLFELSSQVARDATIKFPRSYENWEILSTLEGVSDLEKLNALKKMRELDPLNPNLK
jgi:O-antigen ligase